MHALHARTPKHFVLEERLETYQNALELYPTHLAGTWKEACAPVGTNAVARTLSQQKPSAQQTFERLCVDLGCGKGSYLAQKAQAEPHNLHIGIDYEPLCLAFAAQKICEGKLTNAVVFAGTAQKLVQYFAPAEVDELTLNFPTPHPRKKEAHERLTYLDQLLTYANILAPRGTLTFKTDSQPFFDFSLTQFELAHYELLWVSRDATKEHPSPYTSEYENKLVAQGAHVFALQARPTAKTRTLAQHPLSPAYQTARLSLVDYLPQDLSTLDYLPHGMQATIINMKNREIKAQGSTRPPR